MRGANSRLPLTVGTSLLYKACAGDECMQQKCYKLCSPCLTASLHGTCEHREQRLETMSAHSFPFTIKNRLTKQVIRGSDCMDISREVQIELYE